MDQEDRTDLLMDETVDDIRQVFLVDHVFPTEWVSDAKPQRVGFVRSVGDWLRRSLGLRTPDSPAGEDARGPRSSA
jgi:hypothetical protein